MKIGEYKLGQPQHGRVMVTRLDGSVVSISEAALERGLMDAIDQEQ